MARRSAADTADAAVQVNTEDLSTALVRYLALAVGVSGVIWCVIAIRAPTLLLLAGMLCLVTACFAAYRACRHSILTGAWVLASGTAAAIAVLSQVEGLSAAVYFLALPPAMLAFTAGAVAGFGGAVCSAIIAVLLTWGSDTMTAAILLVLAVGACCSLAAYVSRAQLAWAWRRSQEADSLSQQLRDGQGKLHRTMKTLELTNHLLQRTNRELELARRDAEEARRMKAEFAAAISHELRTPLNIILGFTEIMSRSPEVYGDMAWPLTLRRDVSEIRRNAVYLSEFVDDVLDLARIDALRMPIRREPTRLVEVVGEAVEVVRRLLQGKQVELRLQVPEALPLLLIDRTRVRQVLLNLLTNACRFTDEGYIAVTARESDGEVVLEVTDTGTGIPEDALERVFDAFEQVQGWGRSGEGGKGLGLAVAKQLVQLHGGRIWAQSTVGVGSTFSFSLPVAPKAVSRLSWTGDAHLAGGAEPRRIVVLDEEDLATTYLRRHFEGYGFQQARDAEEAAAAIAELHPVAVMVNLPPEGDVPTAWLRQVGASPGTPVVGCSLPGRHWLRQDERFAAVLTKPVSAQALVTAVRGLAPSGIVLVVDDDRGFVQFVRRTFQAEGELSRLQVAYDGAEALELARAQTPALALVDLVMPALDGFALADAFAADPTLRAVPLVAVSGASPGEEALSMRGDMVVVCKPMGFRGKELTDLLGAVLAAVRADYVTRPDSAEERSPTGTARRAS